MELAKNCIDVGVQTNDREGMLAFWQKEVGLPFEEMLPLGRGRQQHRHGLVGSVFKLNHARDPLPDTEPAGYYELRIATPSREAPRELCDPDGNRLHFVPLGEGGVTAIGVHLRVRDPLAHRDFYGRVLGLERVADDAFRCGHSVISFERHHAAPADASMEGRGFRYVTIQVPRVDAAHAAVLERGGREGAPPVTLGEVARISFVRDPDGNWIELSQRASLTGSLES